jgi:hypothetical protein
VVHHDPAHQRGGHGEEVRAALPVGVRLVDQLQVDLVDERRRLQGVAGTLATHVAPGQPAQLGLDEGDELVERGPVPVAPVEEQLADGLLIGRGRRHPEPSDSISTVRRRSRAGS